MKTWIESWVIFLKCFKLHLDFAAHSQFENALVLWLLIHAKGTHLNRNTGTFAVIN